MGNTKDGVAVRIAVAIAWKQKNAANAENTYVDRMLN